MSELASSPAIAAAIVTLATAVGGLSAAIRFYARRVQELESTRRSNLSEFVRRAEAQLKEQLCPDGEPTLRELLLEIRRRLPPEAPPLIDPRLPSDLIIHANGAKSKKEGEDP